MSDSDGGDHSGLDAFNHGPVNDGESQLSHSVLDDDLIESPTRFTYRFAPDYIECVRNAWMAHVRGTRYANETTLPMVLRELGFSPTYGDIQAYLRAYDRAGTGERLTFASLCDVLKTHMQDNPVEVFERALISAFRVFDEEAEGYVDTHTIERALQQLPCIERKPEIAHLIGEMDREREGYISYEYFVRALCGNFEKGLAKAPQPRKLKFTQREVLEELDELVAVPPQDGFDPAGVEAVIQAKKKEQEQRQAEKTTKQRVLLRRKKANPAAAGAGAAGAAGAPSPAAGSTAASTPAATVEDE